jgi:hypothetical protein
MKNWYEKSKKKKKKKKKNYVVVIFYLNNKIKYNIKNKNININFFKKW